MSCSGCRWSVGHLDGLYCRYWRDYCWKSCQKWERGPGADDEEKGGDVGRRLVVSDPECDERGGQTHPGLLERE